MQARPIQPHECALLIIDLANDFVYPGGVIADAGGTAYQQRAQQIVPRLARLAAAARAAGVTVAFATTPARPATPSS